MSDSGHLYGDEPDAHEPKPEPFESDRRQDEPKQATEDVAAHEPPSREPPAHESLATSEQEPEPGSEPSPEELPGYEPVPAAPSADLDPAAEASSLLEPEAPSDNLSQGAGADAAAYSDPDPAPTPDPEPVHEPTEAAEPAPLPSAPSAAERLRRLAFRREQGEKPAKRAKESKGQKDKRAKKLVGLKIGASQIAAARVFNDGAPEVVEAVREPLEPGLVVAGEIRDAEALGSALQRFFELHKLPKKGVRLGVANNRIGVRVFEIEGVTEEQQLENAIRFRAEEVLPIPLDQAVLDYVVLDEGERPDGTAFRRILLVVAYREVVERYLEACRGAGLEIVGIDLEAFALLRSLAAPADRDQSQGALVAVAVGHDRTTIAVSTGRYCEFTRVLEWGGWSLNVAIARELDRAPSEVEAIKRHLSFSHESEVDGLTPEQAAKTRDGVQRALAAFARELVASLHFYQAQPGALGIGEIVVTGGTAHMDGFPEALGRLIGVPVRLGDPFSRVTAAPDLADIDNPGSLAVAVGLGIED